MPLPRRSSVPELKIGMVDVAVPVPGNKPKPLDNTLTAHRSQRVMAKAEIVLRTTTHRIEPPGSISPRFGSLEFPGRFEVAKVP